MAKTLFVLPREAGASAAINDDRGFSDREHQGSLLTAFYEQSKILPFVTTRPVPKASKAVWFDDMGTVAVTEKTEGTATDGTAGPGQERITIPLDLKKIITEKYVGDNDMHMVNTAWSANLGTRQGQALANVVDKRMFQALALGAAVAARTIDGSVFPAGISVDAPVDGAVTVAYPLTMQGSERLQASLAGLAQTMDEGNLPREGRVAFLTPYLARVLRIDKTIQSYDFTHGENDLLSRTVTKVEGFMIVETNEIPSTLIEAGETAYRGDFTDIVLLAIASPEALGLVDIGGVQNEGPDRDPETHASLIQAHYWMGGKYIKANQCAKVVLTTAE